MRRFSILLALLLALLFTLTVEAQSRFGGTVTFGTYLQNGFDATTAQTFGLDAVLMTDDSARQRIVSRTGVLTVARDEGEIEGAFEVIMLQRFIPLGRSVDTYIQSGLGGFNQVVLDADDELYLYGVVEIGINVWSIISLGVGSSIIFLDEGNQYNLYGKIDFMRMPL